jgi:hypothetical protein
MVAQAGPVGRAAADEEAAVGTRPGELARSWRASRTAELEDEEAESLFRETMTPTGMAMAAAMMRTATRPIQNHFRRCRGGAVA